MPHQHRAAQPLLVRDDLLVLLLILVVPETLDARGRLHASPGLVFRLIAVVVFQHPSDAQQYEDDDRNELERRYALDAAEVERWSGWARQANLLVPVVRHVCGMDLAFANLAAQIVGKKLEGSAGFKTLSFSPLQGGTTDCRFG